MRRISFALAALATVVVTAHADVYKSVDAQGQVRYSDQWSPGAVLIKGDGSKLLEAPTAPASAPAVAPNDHTLAPDPAKAAASKQVHADIAAQRAEQCQQLKEQYAKVIQAKAVAIVACWTAVVALIGFGLLKMVMGIRVTEEEEREGLDISSHGEKAYGH